MMSLWDALRMNMMISYQELVRTFLSTNASNNPSYGKTAFISFAVPAGATYQITSYPAQNYSCGSGVFSVFGYQT
ncbi:hypothetical protein AAGO58_27630, partial [Klebsiella pneumoniae]